MADPAPPTVCGTGSVTIRVRPAVLLTLVPVRAAEPSLDYGLARLRAQADQTAALLKRLGAGSVEAGEPHFADQPDKKGPMAQAREVARRMGGAGPVGVPARGSAVRLVLTAAWDIAGLSAEETLLLIDRLRFETAAPDPPSDPPDDPPEWADPQEQVQAMMAKMAQLHDPAEDDAAAAFLFVARPGPADDDRALAEAFARARRDAERTARAVGRRLGRLGLVMTSDRGDHAHHKFMDQQRAAGLLATSTYLPAANELVTDDPRAAEFTVGVTAHYDLEG